MTDDNLLTHSGDVSLKGKLYFKGVFVPKRSLRGQESVPMVSEETVF